LPDDATCVGPPDSRGDEPICYRGPLCQLPLSKRAAQLFSHTVKSVKNEKNCSSTETYNKRSSRLLVSPDTQPPLRRGRLLKFHLTAAVQLRAQYSCSAAARSLIKHQGRPLADWTDCFQSGPKLSDGRYFTGLAGILLLI